MPRGAQENQGRSDRGGYWYLYPPNSAKVNFLWGKNDVRTAIQQFYTPQKNFIPPKQISGYAPEENSPPLSTGLEGVAKLQTPNLEKGRP